MVSEPPLPLQAHPACQLCEFFSKFHNYPLHSAQTPDVRAQGTIGDWGISREAFLEIIDGCSNVVLCNELLLVRDRVAIEGFPGLLERLFGRPDV